jgi:predicted secreted protein
MKINLTRRGFIRTGLAAAAGAGLSRYAFADAPASAPAKAAAQLVAKADAMIHIWLPGGMAQTDTWDPKKYTPYRAGMKGSKLLGTCEPIPTSADGIFLGKGLDNIASVMNRGTILRTLSSETKFGAVHLKAQYYAMTGYLFPSGVRTPSLGAAVARTLGRRNPQVPAYIYIGRDIDTSDEEKLFISEYIGPGFYGVNYAPFMIPDPAKGLSTLNAVSGMKMDRLDRRQEYLRAITGLAEPELQQANKAKDYMKVMEDARAMMDSPVKRAFDFLKDEKPETVKAYEPEIGASDLLDKTYYYGNRFGQGLLLARRLVEAGARYIQVEYQYGPFKGFDMHEDGRTRMIEMKRQVDRPIAQLIKDLDERGLLDRTLVMISTEFGRTIASAPAAGKEPDGFAERNTGENLVIENEKMYGFHGHFSSGNCLAFFGGGFKQGFVYGKTANQHPMLPIENSVCQEDAHATVYKALGIPADTNYVTEGRPFYVTKNGKGVPVDALLA